MVKVHIRNGENRNEIVKNDIKILDMEQETVIWYT